MKSMPHTNLYGLRINAPNAPTNTAPPNPTPPPDPAPPGPVPLCTVPPPLARRRAVSPHRGAASLWLCLLAVELPRRSRFPRRGASSPRPRLVAVEPRRRGYLRSPRSHPAAPSPLHHAEPRPLARSGAAFPHRGIQARHQSAGQTTQGTPLPRSPLLHRPLLASSLSTSRGCASIRRLGEASPRGCACVPVASAACRPASGSRRPHASALVARRLANPMACAAVPAACGLFCLSASALCPLVSLLSTCLLKLKLTTLKCSSSSSTMDSCSSLKQKGKKESNRLWKRSI